MAVSLLLLHILIVRAEAACRITAKRCSISEGTVLYIMNVSSLTQKLLYEAFFSSVS
jgi:hypothetical protein